MGTLALSGKTAHEFQFRVSPGVLNFLEKFVVGVWKRSIKMSENFQQSVNRWFEVMLKRINKEK